MKKHLGFPLFAMILLLTASAFAQLSNGPVKAAVPFDFVAGNIHLPAGEYRIGAISNLGNLSIVGKGSAMGMVSSRRAVAKSQSATSKLVFHRYGDRYFLSQIWVQGEDYGRELPMTKLEQELRASNARPSSIAILASRQN